MRGKRSKAALAVALLLAAQALVVCLWAMRKTNCYVDELYSMMYAHSVSALTPGAVYFPDNPVLWRPGRWIYMSLFRTLLRVQPGESILAETPLSALKTLLTGRNYMGLLNIAEALLHPGEASRLGGTVLNLLVLVCSQMLLWHVLRRLHVRRPLAFFALAMYGFCGMTLSLAIYVRFYLWACLLFLAVIALHLAIWRERRLPLQLLYEAAVLALSYLALRNSELIFILCGALFGAFAAGLLLRRRFASAAAYALPVGACGLWYVARYTSLLDILLHPASYAGPQGAEAWTSQNVVNASLASFRKYLLRHLEYAQTYLFGSRWVVLGFAAALVLLAVLAFAGRRRRRGTKAGNRAADWGFVGVLAVVVVVYTVFSSLAGLNAPRYYSFALMLICVLLWFALDRLLRLVRWKKACTVAMAVLVAASGLTASLAPNVLNVYPEDEACIEEVQRYPFADILMIYAGSGRRHAFYETVWLSQDDQRLCVLEEGSPHVPRDLKDTVLVWVYRSVDITPYRQELEGYSFSYLGRTHISDVYVAWRMERAPIGLVTPE